MIALRMASRWLVMAMIAGLALCAHAQAPSDQGYTPSVGQAGKDVVWVPSPQALVDKMLDMAKLTPNDLHMDLGSGDGRTVITAAKRGARSIGVEYNPDMVALSRKNAAAAGVSDRATFINGDIFQTDISKANVITLFLLTDLNIRLRPTLMAMKPGTRVVSNTFRMGDWEPDETFALGCDTYCTAYLWIVPARVEGRWKLAQGELTLKQEYQMVSGALRNGGAAMPITGGKLRGDEISFTAGGSEYRGRVSAKGIEGTVKNGGSTAPWSARR